MEIIELNADEKLKNIKEFSDSMKSGMFASRKTPKEALDYAYNLIETLQASDRIVAFTALHVTINSISEELDREIS